MNKIDYLEKELSRLLFWIQSADTRVALVLPLTTAMLGLLAALSPPIEKWGMYISILILALITIILLVCSIGSLAFATFPRTNGPKGSLIYFEGIKSNSNSQYKKAVLGLEEKEYIDDLINQCFINAEIAKIKFSWIKKSLAFLFFSTPLWFLSIYLLYGIRSL